jgi:mxaA protein
MLMALAAAGARAVESAGTEVAPIVTLRDSGYMLGDLLDERVDLALPRGFALNVDSLPLPGRVAPWMEVRRTRVERGDRRDMATVVVTYQIFAEVEQASRVPIPSFKLRMRDAAMTRVVAVPEQSFLLSPALPPALADEDREIKPSPAPEALPAGGILARLVLALVAALGCGIYLLWAHDRLPFLPRSRGPFARLWRRWRKRERSALTASDRAALLRDWHCALNQAAGQTLYRSTLPLLFERVAYLQPLRGEVETLFAHSWQSFYGPANDGPPAPAVFKLLRTAAERERGVPC